MPGGIEDPREALDHSGCSVGDRRNPICPPGSPSPDHTTYCYAGSLSRSATTSNPPVFLAQQFAIRRPHRILVALEELVHSRRIAPAVELNASSTRPSVASRGSGNDGAETAGDLATETVERSQFRVRDMCMQAGGTSGTCDDPHEAKTAYTMDPSPTHAPAGRHGVRRFRRGGPLHDASRKSRVRSFRHSARRLDRDFDMSNSRDAHRRPDTHPGLHLIRQTSPGPLKEDELARSGRGARGVPYLRIPVVWIAYRPWLHSRVRCYKPPADRIIVSGSRHPEDPT